MKFSGIKPEGLELLAINRFNNSKTFYEENNYIDISISHTATKCRNKNKCY